MKISTTFVSFVIILCLFSAGLNADQSIFPLEPPDRSSPRATLKTFLDNTNEAVGAYKRHQLPVAADFALKAAQCLDLETKPPAIRNMLGFESVIYLKEILDRIALPPFDEIPDKKDVKAEKLDSWTIPHTQISIAVTNKGVDGGKFLFTGNTVASLEEYYNKVKKLPFMPDSGGGAWAEELISSSNFEIINRVVRHLPGWTKLIVFGQTVWQWVGLALFLIVGVTAIVVIYKLTSNILIALDRRLNSNVEQVIGGLVIPLALIAFSEIGLWFISKGLHMFNVGVYLPVAITFLIIGYIGALWLIGAILNRVAGTVIKLGGFVAGNVDTQLIRFGFDLVTVAIMLTAIVRLGGQLGLPTYSLVGGLGISGIAIALAGREALSNLIGTVVILLDHPFKLGDYIVLGEKTQGTVTDIGLRSTRILTLNGLLVSVPNSTVANMEIINESAPSSETQISIPVGVAYGSNPGEVEESMLSVAQANQYVAPDPSPSVRFVSFGDSSINFELLVWIVRPEIKNIAISQMNQAIYQEFQQKGIEMPFPQRDIHIKTEN